ncbi:MAG: bifunctional demethylmenaquinone methyltransferase/2-methoxy-6-polyprenyl-1,4-benzoquinol methylase UbiE [Cyanobacteria bacterium]|nr:bifunctional demethylmenaquinone methyltransferase/2-methoxy-6-polyprenyl-1,4-benzoquinol methylase UbiE [Cyanobacteriota bacterium]
MPTPQAPPDRGDTTPPTAATVQALFDRIAPVYDDFNQQLSLGLHWVWKRMAVAWSGAAPGHTCLDLCCGSGDLALLLARQVAPGGQVWGVDFSPAQLAVAQQRASRQWPHPAITWQQGDALALAFEDGTFDAATLGYGLRNLTDIPQGLRELRRVLKPGARAAVLDFHPPSHGVMRQFQRWYLDTVLVPTADRCGLTAEYAYIAPSVDRFPQGDCQVALALGAGFTHAVHYPLAGGLMGVLVATR